MIGDHDDPNEVDEIDDEFNDEESTNEPDLPTANVGETSVEIDVEELIAELEADSGVSSGSTEGDPRKRLEKILEERRAARELEEMDEYALDLHD